MKTKAMLRATAACVLAVSVLAPVRGSATNNTSTVLSLYGGGQWDKDPTSGRYAYLQLTSYPSGAPQCNLGTLFGWPWIVTGYYVIDLTSEGGRANFAIALAAKLAGKQVQVVGFGVCGGRSPLNNAVLAGATSYTYLPGDAEVVRYLIVAN